MKDLSSFFEQLSEALEPKTRQDGPQDERHGSRGEHRGFRSDERGERGRSRPGDRGAGEESSGPTPGPGWGPFGRPGAPPFGGAGLGPLFGFPPFGGKRRGRGGDWPPFGRGPKVRRGDVRAAALVLLSEQPRNGYQIIQEIAERSSGMWKPSSGSVYPALQQLEDEGLVEIETLEGKRTFKLTTAGRTYVEAHKEELGAPWEAMAAGLNDASMQIHALLGQVAMAVIQVSQAATPNQMQKARQVLVDARRALYQILAEADDNEDETVSQD